MFVRAGQNEGCLEVKCPYLCLRKSIAEASLESSSFCLRTSGDKLHLKETHQYFYQVQAQLYITRLPWCDFVVWSPNKEILVERIYYNQHFIMQAIAKARIFYFDVFLPSIVPCVVIHTSSSHNDNANSFHVIRNVEVHEEKDTSIHTETPPSVQNHNNKDCMIVCVTSYQHRPMFCRSCILEGIQLMVMEIACIMLSLLYCT